MQLQEYDLEIVHIKGMENFFADTLSRNPIGLSQESRDLVIKPRELFVAKVDLGLDKTLMKQLGNLAEHQQGDPTLMKIREKVESNPTKVEGRYMIRDRVLYCKNDRTHPYWRAMLPRQLEHRVIEYVHTLSGHPGTDKCMQNIAHSFHIKSLGRKVRRFVAYCDICQRAKHPNRAYEMDRVSHLPTKPGELLSVDLYGPLPTGRGGVKYLLVCLEFFSKHVNLYPLKTATTRSCLKKLREHYFQSVIKPEVIISDHGSQFSSPAWQKALAELGIKCKYSPIRHPESNPAERIMRELGKYFRIYCHETHKKWPELVPYIQNWLNSSVCESTGYAPVELLNRTPRPDVFRKILKKEADHLPEEEALTDKLLKAYARMKLRAEKRNKRRKTGSTRWEPKLHDVVLVKSQSVSDAVQGVTSKFQLLYEGPYLIYRKVNPSIYELADSKGKIRGIFKLKHLKPYLTEKTEEEEIIGRTK
jgi:transposase InsO family protein